MGFLAAVVEFLRSTVDGAHAPEAKVDRGDGDGVTAYHFAPPGDDSQPLAGDVAYLGGDEGTGNAQALGYQDPATEPLAGPGEKRIYARSGPGVAVCEVWLKADGTVTVTNGTATFELAPDGAVSVGNGQGSIDVDAAGIVTATTPHGTFGAGTHAHTTPFGPSGPPMPGT
jgi:hypothetical protein